MDGHARRRSGPDRALTAMGLGAEPLTSESQPQPEPDTGGATSAPDHRPWRVRHEHLLWVVVAYVASRLAVLLTAKLATWYAKPLSVSQALTGWDSSWYLQIAREGYASGLMKEGPGNRWGFFPALPSMVRAVHWITPFDWSLSGILVALVTGLTAAIAVYLAMREVLGRDVAMAAATLFCFLPNAYTLSMVYTEGLFITFAGLCLFFLVRRDWIFAGVVTAAAGLTRSTAVVLIACCAFEAARVAWTERSWRPLLAPALAPLGLLSFMAYSWHRIGEPFAFVKAQNYWQNGFDWFRPVYHGVVDVFTDRASWQDAQAVLATLALVVTAAAFVALLRTREVPGVWWVYSVGILVVAISPFWLFAIPRYLLPSFALLGAVVGKVPERARSPLVSMSAVLMGALALGMFTSIVTWQNAPLAP